MFDVAAVIAAARKAANDLRARAGGGVLLSDAAALLLALAPLAKLFPQTSTEMVGRPLVGHGDLLTGIGTLPNGDQLASRFEHASDQIEMVAANRGNVGATESAAANHPFLQSLLTQLGPLALQLLIRGLTSL